MPNLAESAERRIHDRIKSSIGANVDNAMKSDFTHLRNISKGGAFIHSFIQMDYRIGQNVIVTLPAKKQENIKLLSKIVWIDKDGIGVKFIKYYPRPV